MLYYVNTYMRSFLQAWGDPKSPPTLKNTHPFSQSREKVRTIPASRRTHAYSPLSGGGAKIACTFIQIHVCSPTPVGGAMNVFPL